MEHHLLFGKWIDVLVSLYERERVSLDYDALSVVYSNWKRTFASDVLFEKSWIENI